MITYILIKYSRIEFSPNSFCFRLTMPTFYTLLFVKETRAHQTFAFVFVEKCIYKSSSNEQAIWLIYVQYVFSPCFKLFVFHFYGVLWLNANELH